MSNFKAKVQVILRPSVLDPAGEAAKMAALKLGIKGLTDLRIGKAIDISLEAPTKEDARKQIEFLSERLLSNPVIENWSMELNSSDSTNLEN